MSWIKCSERLPNIGQQAIFISPDGQEIQTFVRRNHILADDSADDRDVVSRGYTHWQPLPEPPKDGE